MNYTMRIDMLDPGDSFRFLRGPDERRFRLVDRDVDEGRSATVAALDAPDGLINVHGSDLVTDWEPAKPTLILTGELSFEAVPQGLVIHLRGESMQFRLEDADKVLDGLKQTILRARHLA